VTCVKKENERLRKEEERRAKLLSKVSEERPAYAPEARADEEAKSRGRSLRKKREKKDEKPTKEKPKKARDLVEKQLAGEEDMRSEAGSRHRRLKISFRKEGGDKEDKLRHQSEQSKDAEAELTSTTITNASTEGDQPAKHSRSRSVGTFIPNLTLNPFLRRDDEDGNANLSTGHNPRAGIPYLLSPRRRFIHHRDKEPGKGRTKSTYEDSHRVFGISLRTLVQREGESIPGIVLGAVAALQREGVDPPPLKTLSRLALKNWIRGVGDSGHLPHDQCPFRNR